MKLKETVKRVMDFSKEHASDMNTSCARMLHLINAGEIKDITKEELEDAQAFIRDNYTLAVAARKGAHLAEYDEAIEEWEQK